MQKVRLTVNTERADVMLEARKISDFLFERCNGNIAEAAVLDYLRRLREERKRFPWTKHGDSEAITLASEAAGT